MYQSFKTFLFLVILGINHTYAQTGKLEVGIEGGINRSNISRERFKSDSKSLIFVSGGVSFQYHFSNYFSLKTGLNYEARGFEYPITITYQNHVEYPWFSTRFDFLTLPIMARLTLGEKVQFFLNAGIYFSTAINVSGHLEGDEPGFNHTHTTYLEVYEKRDFGFLAGIGMRLPVNEKWSLSLETRGTMGFADAGKKILTQKWESANILVGVNYRLKPSDPDNPYVQNKRLMIGIEGGLTHTFVYSDFAHRPAYEYPYQNYTFEKQSKSGYSYGLSLQWNFRNRLSIRSGLSYDYKEFYSQTSFNYYNGYNTYTGEISSIAKQTSSFDYLTVPLMAKITFGKKFQIFCNAGIYLAFLTRQSDYREEWLRNNFGGPAVYNYKESNNNGIHNYRKMDGGLSGGLGIAVPIGKHLLISAEWRHYYGLRNNWRPDYNKEQPFLAKGALLFHTVGGNLGIAYRFSSRETNK
jgi:hypothetical protein